MKTNKLIKILKHPVVTGSALLVGGGMVVNAINLLYHFVMGKMLGPVNYGVLLSLYSILYILSIVPLSSSVAIVKFISKAKTKKERSIVYHSLKRFIFYIALFGSLGVILFSPLIAKFLNITDLLSTVLTAGVLFFSLITLVNQSSLQGVFKFFGVVGPNLISSVVKLALGILLVVLGFSVGGAMFAVVVGVGAAYFLSLKLLGKSFSKQNAGLFDLRPFIKYSAPVLVQALAFTSFFTADVILVKHFFSAHEAGLYAALSTLGKIVYFGASPVASAMFPYVSRKHAAGEKYMRVFFSAILITIVISFGIIAFYLFLPRFIIGTLYGKEYLAVAGDLVWMGLFIGFYTLANLFVNFYLSVDKVKVVILPLVFALLQIILIWILHSSLLQVIQVSLFEMMVLCLMFIVYLVYLRYGKKEVKK